MATGTLTDGTSRDLTGEGTWSSSDETVAAITSPDGKATGLKVCQVTITARVGLRFRAAEADSDTTMRVRSGGADP